MKNIWIVALMAVLGIAFSACQDKDVDNEAQILDYIEQNNLNAQSTPEGLYYVIENEGTGTRPTALDYVEVRYSGYFLDGEVFDETEGQNTYIAPLNGLIQGWQIGIPLIKEGGRIKLLVPSSLGYGASGSISGTIPGNTALIFDIDLIDVK